MLSFDRDALICDLAETYGIYSLDSVPASTLATLAVGLRDGSRIRTEIRRAKEKDKPETETDMNTLLLARIADSLAWLQWSRTTDGQKNRNRPKSLLSVLLGMDEKKKEENNTDNTARRFDTPEEFEKAWKGGG